MTARREAAVETLRRLGADVDALAAGRVETPALRALLTGPDGAAAAAALAEFASPAVAAALAELQPALGERAVRKAVRRTLYLLAQRGVPVPAAPPAPSRPPPAAGSDVEGLVSHVDGRGDRLVWLVRPESAGGVLLVGAQVNEPGGLRDLHVGDLGRKQLRAARQRLEREARIRLVPAPWRVLDALLVEAHARTGSAERSLDYPRVRARLTSEPPLAPAEPRSARVRTPEGEEAAGLVAASAALFEEPTFATWGPEPAAAAPFAEEIRGIDDSPLVLSRVQQEERVRQILQRAAATLAPPAVLARRLEATAYVLAETGRLEPARWALAVAAALAARPSDAAAVPFVAVWVERAVGALLAREAAERETSGAGSLVVTPGQFLRDRASSHPGRTRG